MKTRVPGIVHGSMEPIPVPIRDESAAEREVLERSRRLAQRLASAAPDGSVPPFDPAVYASLLGIRIKEKRSLKSWDAMLVPVGRRPLIVCNSAVRSERRRRFSVAHEIAHTFFSNADATYHLRTRERDAYGHSPDAHRLERAVDRGAAELLMPEPWFGEAVEWAGVRAAAVPRLAEEFQVSLTAAARRLIEDAAGPRAAVFFDLARPPGGSGRVAYRVKPGGAFRSAGFPFLFPPWKSVPDGSLVHRSSLQTEELEGEETYVLGRTEGRLHVQAFPLHRDERISGPPLVCALFRLA